MFERLTDRLQTIFQSLGGKGRLTERDVDTAMREVRTALLEADVNLKVVREESWAVLGLDRADAVDPDQIPELVISELTAEQIKELRDRDHTEVDGAETVQNPSEQEPDDGVVIEGDVEDGAP